MGDELRGETRDAQFAAKLREALTTTAMAGTIGAPVSHAGLLEMIVTTAVHVLRANAGALLLVDEEAEELVFEVAVGGEAGKVKRFRVPLGHGIAGLVAITGQPIAIANAQDDPRSAKDIADQIGYRPTSILCVPLFYEDQIIGVLEVLDKQDRPSFSSEDMDSLRLFANQAAVAIEQSRVNTSVGALIGEVLKALGNGQRLPSSLEPDAAAFAARAEEDPTARQALALAGLVQEIARGGDKELKACRSILESFAEYLRGRRPQSGLSSDGP